MQIQKQALSQLIFRIIFVLLPVAYFLLYALKGYSDTDHGFITALSWRILQGQIPYVDFLYVRPPLSPYLHAFFMDLLPNSFEIIGERLIFYFMMSASVFFSAAALWRIFRPENWGISFWLFACIAFVLTAHNYPPMPWHTMDGIFFSAIGFWLISKISTRKESRRDYIFLILGMTALLLAALCKQPFYLAPLIGLGFSWINFGNKAGAVSLAVTLGFLGLIMLLFNAQHPEYINQLLSQITGATSFGDLFAAGFRSYFKPAGLAILFLILYFINPKSIRDKIPLDSIRAILFWIMILGILILNVWKAFHENIPVAPSYGYTHLFLLIAIIGSWKAYAENKEKGLLLLALLIVSWASGVSWGYATPILFITPALFGTLYFLHGRGRFQASGLFYPCIFICLLGIYFSLHHFPYRDSPRNAPYKNLSDFNPKFKHVQTGEEHYAKLTELVEIQDQFQGNFTVLPAMPIVHYLFNLDPVFLVDWAHNAEMLYDKNEDAILHSLNEKCDYVVIEKDKKYQANEVGKYGSKIAKYVLENWHLKRETRFFEIYHP